ncbi:MAG: recombinase family protein [Spirochaetales bacterium]|nr:recombinase family protein [Spirochaetales bacterium]
MKVAYIRVSTKEQNTARQEEALQGFGIERSFIEKISGKNTDRPQLKAMLDYVREGDTVVVESYSRLARSTYDLLNIVEELNRKNVAFVSLKENVDTSTPQGKLMLTIFAGLAQFERECILQRQAEGIAIAKAEGKYRGRKPIEKPSQWNDVIKLWKEGEITAVVAQRKLGLTPATFYRKVKELA